MCVDFHVLELGLNRKAIKSSQNSIDLFFSTDTADSMGVYCYLRACVVKGKALLSSGKVSDAVQAWSDGVVKAVSFGPTVVVDVGLLMELNSLVEVNRTDTNEASVVLSVAAPTAAAMVAPEQLSPMPSPASPVKAASQPVSPSKPANATNSTESVQVETAAVSVQAAPTLPAVPPRPATKAPQRSATSNKMTAPAAPTSTATSTTVASTAPAAVDDAAAEQAAKEIYRSAMMAIHRRSIGDSDEHAIKPFYLNAIRANLPHICGEPLVDDLICLSYINVNSGNLEAASSIFKLLNEYRTDLPAALIGAGSIAAMQRNFDEAIAQFTRALSINDTIADAWKRRGQTRAAKGLIKTALKDLTKAIALIPQDADCYNQRGLVYHQTRNYTRALADFKAAHARGLASAALLNNLGMCEGQLGFVQPSIDAHLKAIRVEPTFKEAHLNVALMHKEAGDWANALVAFDSAIKCDSKPFFQAYGHRGLMYAQLGRPAAALKDLLLAINVLFSIVKSADGGAAGAGAGVVTYTAEEKNTRRNELVLNLVRAAMCYQQLGQYHKSTGFIDQALSMHPGHTCWFQKEIGLFLWTGVDVDLSLYNLDDRTDPRLKDGWCKHANFDYMVVHRIGSNPASTIQPLPVTPGVPAPVLGVGCYGLQRKPAKTPVLYRYSDAIPCDEDGEQIPTAGAPASPAASAEVKKSRCAYDPTEGAVQSMRDERAKLQLVQQTMPIARWIQLDSPGFLPNRRQHRMFGVAVLQMAMSLTRHLSLISLEGIGLLIPDVVSSRAATTTATPAAAVATSTATSSAPALQISKVSPNMAVVSSSTAARLSAPSSSRGGSPSGKRGATKTHTFNWRDLYDIAVRWRQVSEPGDPVWWIDRFPAKAFEEGFGLQTPLVNGHLTTVRYEPYYEPAFDRVKDILQQRGYYTVSDQFVQLDADERQTVGEARTLAQLRAAVGRDFYVVVPCPSLRSPSAGLVLEGTRLTLLTQEPEGFDFTIRTPGIILFLYSQRCIHAYICSVGFVLT